MAFRRRRSFRKSFHRGGRKRSFGRGRGRSSGGRMRIGHRM